MEQQAGISCLAAALLWASLVQSAQWLHHVDSIDVTVAQDNSGTLKSTSPVYTVLGWPLKIFKQAITAGMK